MHRNFYITSKELAILIHTDSQIYNSSQILEHIWQKTFPDTFKAVKEGKLCAHQSKQQLVTNEAGRSTKSQYSHQLVGSDNRHILSYVINSKKIPKCFYFPTENVQYLLQWKRLNTCSNQLKDLMSHFLTQNNQRHNSSKKDFGTLMETQSLEWFRDKVIHSKHAPELVKRLHVRQDPRYKVLYRWCNYIPNEKNEFSWYLYGKRDAFLYDPVSKSEVAVVEIKNRVSSASAHNPPTIDVIQLLSYLLLSDLKTGYLAETSLSTLKENDVKLKVTTLQQNYLLWKFWILPRLYAAFRCILFLEKNEQWKKFYFQLSSEQKNHYLEKALNRGSSEVPVYWWSTKCS